ncbi:MerR-like helix-turn-helix DNA binding domain protein [Gordonia phage Hexbug]|nr:MerR-like helix-turn-helix DNA binding domain protein [Gordonia phage Orla]UVK62957.1 MerR-like helix-turn-helix DNA binding domain protein [Gordonia phage Hexbug]
MNTAAAAQLIGIAPRQLRAFLRRNPSIIDRDAQSYSLTADDVERVREAYWADRPVADLEDIADDDDSTRLTIADLRDPSMREQFEALRRERAQRLDTLLRSKRMTVAQMSNHTLVSTGRALAIGDEL